MSYQINFTDSVNKGFIQVDENTVNTETSLDLPGRLKSDYGKLILENLLHLMENFANNNPPTNPIEGQLWYDTTLGIDQLKVYDGVQWVSASNIKKSNSRPLSVESNLGDLWVDTTNQQLFLYNGNDWTLIGPEFSLGSNTGAKFEEIIDTTNVARSVVVNYVNSIPLLIVSNDEFTPKSTITGFSLIRAGLNLATGLKYYGTAEAAENLIIPGEGNVFSSNFARRDKDNTFTRPIRIQNNGGISIGETPSLQLSILSSNSILRNLASNGDIQFRLTQGVNSNTVLTLKSNGRLGVNTANPAEALDVVGNIKTSGNILAAGTLEVNGTTLLKDNVTVNGNLSAGNITVSDILPSSSGKNIGTNLLRFNNVFAQTINSTTFTGNTFTGTFFGTLTGSATSLSSNTQFQMLGEVQSTNIISFGGSGNVGGSTRVFDTIISPTFITNKPVATSVKADDEILIVINNELRKIRQELLVSTVPIIPTGLITPYGGDIPPSGWLLCDGSTVLISGYSVLFSIVGWKFDPTLTGSSSFKLPDLRGRFPLGNTSMLNTGLNISNTNFDTTKVINEPESSQLGAISGSSTKIIQSDNLPEHNHTLSKGGTTFYASTNIPNAPGSDVNIPNFFGNLQSSSISQTGGVAGNIGDPLSVINPYQTVNYIIYTGATNQ
jgi:microcystin-dependent protein